MQSAGEAEDGRQFSGTDGVLARHDRDQFALDVCGEGHGVFLTSGARRSARESFSAEVAVRHVDGDSRQLGQSGRDAAGDRDGAVLAPVHPMAIVAWRLFSRW